MTDKKIFFMHIAKTAGTSFNNFIANHYDSKNIFTHIESHPSWATGTDIEVLQQASFISGHIKLPIFQTRFKEENYFKITFLREPYSHISSHLSWVRNLSINKKFFERHPQHVQDITKKMLQYDFNNPKELSDYLASMNNHEKNLFDNCQSRYFIQPKFGESITKDNYREAKKNLEKIDFIGLTEFYEASVVMLSKLKKWPYLFKSEKSNKSINYSGIDFLRQEFQDVLNSYVLYDLDLYDHAKNIFLKECSDYIRRDLESYTKK